MLYQAHFSFAQRWKGMVADMEMKIIGRIHTDFSSKFGLPRQSGLVDKLQGKIILESEYRNADAFRGLEEFSHIWLVWEFSRAIRKEWSPTVRPPRLGGNKRLGVFATRSPFRPNPIGLSCVRLDNVILDAVKGPILQVSGVDMMDGTPIYDIKPYLPYADSYPEACGGFTERVRSHCMKVFMPEETVYGCGLSDEKLEALRGVLEQDPRPRYQQDPERVYGMSFAGHEVRFRVEGDAVYVVEISDEPGKA